MKKVGLLAAVCILSAVLCGCGDNLKLTQEEKTIISNYAANTLLKYARKYDDALVSKGVLEQQEKESSGSADSSGSSTGSSSGNTESSGSSKDSPGSKDSSSSSTESSGSSRDSGTDSSGGEATLPGSGEQPKQEPQAVKPIGEILATEGFDIQYVDCMVTNSYVKDYFAHNAKNGNKLVVFRFAITNTSGEDRVCDLQSGNMKYTIVINGSQSIPAQTTLLLNDLTTFQQEIKAGERVEAVLIGEAASVSGTVALSAGEYGVKLN